VVICHHSPLQAMPLSLLLRGQLYRPNSSIDQSIKTDLYSAVVSRANQRLIMAERRLSLHVQLVELEIPLSPEREAQQIRSTGHTERFAHNANVIRSTDTVTVCQTCVACRWRAYIVLDSA